MAGMRWAECKSHGEIAERRRLYSWAEFRKMDVLCVCECGSWRNVQWLKWKSQMLMRTEKGPEPDYHCMTASNTHMNSAFSFVPLLIKGNMSENQFCFFAMNAKVFNAASNWNPQADSIHCKCGIVKDFLRLSRKHFSTHNNHHHAIAICSGKGEYLSIL